MILEFGSPTQASTCTQLSLNCIVVDDAPVGAQAGIEAGMKTLFFNRFNEECKYNDAISFHSMYHLLRLVKTQVNRD